MMSWVLIVDSVAIRPEVAIDTALALVVVRSYSETQVLMDAALPLRRSPLRRCPLRRRLASSFLFNFVVVVVSSSSALHQGFIKVVCVYRFRSE